MAMQATTTTAAKRDALTCMGTSRTLANSCHHSTRRLPRARCGGRAGSFHVRARHTRHRGRAGPGARGLALMRTARRVRVMWVSLLASAGVSTAFNDLRPPLARGRLRPGPSIAGPAAHVPLGRGPRPAPSSCLRPSRSAALAPGARRSNPRLSSALATASVRQAIMPVLWVVGTCLVGMVPTSAAFLPGKRSQDKLLKRTFTGFFLGCVVSMWIFSSTVAYVFAFCVMGVLAQQEYYMMAQSRGFFPARKLSMVGSLAMYIAGADGRRGVIDAALPLAGIYTTMYLLTRPKPEPTLDDVTTTFMGIYYLGFLPSFWVRLRGLSAKGPTYAFPWWPVRLRPDMFTHGAVITWWTFLSIVCSDIGAYFVGKSFGSKKLISSVSPNKTIEGALGGMSAALCSSILGAWLMGWPLWYVSGAIHGIISSVMALIGDLTISLFKRSSGVKDTGNLLPGHGGLLDRVDSFLLAAAPIYFYVAYALPRFPGAL